MKTMNRKRVMMFGKVVSRKECNVCLKKAMALIEDCVVFDKFGRQIKSETFRKALEE